MKVGYVPGGFDLFHIGHLNILRRSRERCDYLIAGVATDASLIAMKGRPPVVPFLERFEIVAGIRVVDQAVPDFSFDKRIAWEETHFDVLFKGTDWRGTPRGEQLEKQLAQVGARVEYLPYTDERSSTMLKTLIDFQLLVRELPEDLRAGNSAGERNSAPSP